MENLAAGAEATSSTSTSRAETPALLASTGGSWASAGSTGAVREERQASTSLVALLAVSPPAPELRAPAEGLGGRLLKDIASQGGMEVAVYAFGSTTAAIHCARAVLGSDWGRSCCLGMHMGEVAVGEPAFPVGASGVNDKPNSDREGVRIATGLSQQADEGSALLSQVACEIARGEMDVPATYLGPRQVRLVSRTVPVFKMSLGGEQDTRKAAVSKQMDMILMEERQRNQEVRAKRKKQSQIVAAGLVVILMGVFVIGLARLAASGALGQTMDMLGGGGDITEFTEGDNAPPAATELEAPADKPADSNGEQALQRFLSGDPQLTAGQYAGLYCQSLYHLSEMAARWKAPGEVVNQALAKSRFPEGERRIIQERLLSELELVREAGLLDPSGLARLQKGNTPSGYVVIHLLPPNLYPEYAKHPANFALRRKDRQGAAGPPPLEAVELLEKLNRTTGKQ